MVKQVDIPNLDQHVRVTDFEESASKVLPIASWNYLQTGAGDGSTSQTNREIWSRVHLVPRVLRGITSPDTTTVILGRTWQHPIALAPVAAHGAFHSKPEQGQLILDLLLLFQLMEV